MSDEENKEPKIIDPDFSLKKKAGPVSIDKVINSSVISRAETVVEQEKKHLGEDVYKDVLVLEKLFADVQDSEEQKPIIAEMMDTALNVKSGSAMADFPLATEFAKSLYQLCMKLDHLSDSDKAIIQAHISATKQIFNRDMHDMGNTTEQTLLKQLTEYTQKHD